MGKTDEFVKRSLALLVLMVCVACGDSKDATPFDTAPMTKACEKLDVCGVLINGKKADDCVQVQRDKYTDIQAHCTNSPVILSDYDTYWTCMGGLSCEEISAQETPCKDLGAAVRTLLRDCGFDI